MSALTSIGEFVKATEFIGQSSGKNLKGQSQKVQQAVLQKFRTGGYNVIVAISIGEGLDIMEVDLVICFDANISPLRMIQRMGRTGRKNEGRVVVLACEGAELKGYMKKKANSKAIKKHMDNGGMSSFSFHPSPRMIPHIFKPEVQYIEMSIVEFVPCGKKLKDDNLIMPLPLCKTKLTDAETDLLAKYFAASGEVSWRPSLIAFPHFQTSPCHVKKVAHSSTTGMLIDTMQYLQGLRYSQDNETLLTKGKCILDPCLSVYMIETSGNFIRERFDDTIEERPEAEAVQIDVEIREISRVKDVHIKVLYEQKPRTHTFMFGSEFVSLDDLGNVLVLSLPQLPFRPCVQSGTEENKFLETSFRNDTLTGKVLSVPEKKRQASDTNRMSKAFVVDDNIGNNNKEMQLTDESSNDEFRDAKLSPRLSSFIENGVVPESPINRTATWTGGDNSNVPAPVPSENTKGDSPRLLGNRMTLWL